LLTARLCSSLNGARIVPSLTGNVSLNSSLGLLVITGLVSPFGLIYGGIDDAGVRGGVGFPGIGLCWYECIDRLEPPPPTPLFMPPPPGVDETEDELSPNVEDGGTPPAPPGPLFPVGGY